MTTERAAKSALGRLVREANKSPRGTRVLEGEEGLSATLDESEVGQARMVRVLREGEEVYWSFVVQKDEPRPHFFPDEVPHVPSASCMLSWHRNTGINAIWTLGHGDHGESLLAEFAAKLQAIEMPEGMDELVENVKSFGKQGAASLKEGLEAVLPQPFLGKLVDAAEGMFPKELHESAMEIANTVSGFLEGRGWTPTAEPECSRVSWSRTFEREGSGRELKVFSMALASTVGLWERRTPR